jgi:hypothetical protein
MEDLHQRYITCHTTLEERQQQHNRHARVCTDNKHFKSVCLQFRQRTEYIMVQARTAQSYSNWLRAGLPRGRCSIPGGVKNFHFSMSSRQALGSTQPPIQWVLGTLSPGVKQQGHEADPSSPTSAKVKKTWAYTCTPPICLHGIMLN